VTIDVANPGSVLAARDQLLNHYGSETAPLYGLVNNAGIGLGSSDFDSVVDVNTLGVQRVCEAFMPLMEASGRVVNVSSASGPKYVSQCSPQRQQFFRGPNVKWPDVENLIKQAQQACDKPERCKALGLGDLNAYGFSKACVSLYTMALAQQYPQLQINACTPGYIETDLTRPQAKKHGVAPAEMGMKPPAHGTIAILHLLFGHPQGSGHYYGSDAKRSPLDRYRAPGGPEYTGDD
jgi:NAD(P)-dependent dehydrogenase (short-subunit alcohol dehydrogenase family)